MASPVRWRNIDNCPEVDEREDTADLMAGAAMVPIVLAGIINEAGERPGFASGGISFKG